MEVIKEIEQFYSVYAVMEKVTGCFLQQRAGKGESPDGKPVKGIPEQCSLTREGPGLRVK